MNNLLLTLVVTLALLVICAERLHKGIPPQTIQLPVGKHPPRLPPNICWPTGSGPLGVYLAPAGSHETNPFMEQD
jgi:hypothetical protein